MLLLIILVLVLMFATNLLHLRIKSLLRSKGWPVNLFWGQFRDIRLFRQIIRSESDPIAKHEYRVLFRYYCGSLALLTLTLLLLCRGL